LKNIIKEHPGCREKEITKVKENDDVLLKLDEIASVLDRIFSNPENKLFFLS
jgi:hypothetical protein